MKYCPNRCSIVTMGDKFCYKCGEKLMDGPMCGCGRGIGQMDRFCPNCGRPVQELAKKARGRGGDESGARSGDVSRERDERNVEVS